MSSKRTCGSHSTGSSPLSMPPRALWCAPPPVNCCCRLNCCCCSEKALYCAAFSAACGAIVEISVTSAWSGRSAFCSDITCSLMSFATCGLDATSFMAIPPSCWVRLTVISPSPSGLSLTTNSSCLPSRSRMPSRSWLTTSCGSGRMVASSFCIGCAGSNR